MAFTCMCRWRCNVFTAHPDIKIILFHNATKSLWCMQKWCACTPKGCFISCVCATYADAGCLVLFCSMFRICVNDEYDMFVQLLSENKTLRNTFDHHCLLQHLHSPLFFEKKKKIIILSQILPQLLLKLVTFSKCHYHLKPPITCHIY